MNGLIIKYVFSPLQHNQQSRGFSFNGVDLNGTYDSSAWVIWVR